MRRKLFLSIFLLSPSLLFARPILTEPVNTLGLFNFEGGLAISYRSDQFGNPKAKYLTTLVPFSARIGLYKNVDFGISLTHVAQEVDQNDHNFSGSSTGRISPLLKFSPFEWGGLFFQWTPHAMEHTNEELSIASGDDYEIFGILQIPNPSPAKITLNFGSIIRGNYNSRFGIQAVPSSHVKPGNIYEAKLAVEVPIRWNLNLLAESAYYSVEKQSVNDIEVPHSKGKALDLLGGVAWVYHGWDIRTGVGFGVLDESHTSFDPKHGAGDVQFHFGLAYKITPRKPE